MGLDQVHAKTTRIDAAPSEAIAVVVGGAVLRGSFVLVLGETLISSIGAGLVTYELADVVRKLRTAAQVKDAVQKISTAVEVCT